MAGSDYVFPDVNFVDTDTATIAAELEGKYEENFGRKLYPADPVKQLILWFASIISQERSYMNIASKRNLPRYATGEYLDSLCEIFYGITRIEAQAATVELKFTISETLEEDIIIPAGTNATPDGSIYFATIEDLTIGAGDISGTVEAECTETGKNGNGYTAGQINKLVDQLAYIVEVTNTTTSVNGTDIETDEELYSRCRGSYEGYSTAGTAGAYQYYAKQYNATIADVYVHELDPGQTGIVILMDSGVPSEDDISDMQSYLESDHIRPVTDQVIVSVPEAVTFEIELTYYGSSVVEPGKESLQQLVEDATKEYIEWQTSRLGRKINPGKLISKIYEAGASYVELTAPIAQALEKTQCAVLTGIPTLTYGGNDE